MDENAQRSMAVALLARHGRTMVEELGIPLAPDNPSALFRLLVASMLFATPVEPSAAAQAAFALSDYGWTAPQTIARSTWEERVRIFRQAGFGQHDESSSRMLEGMVQRILTRYDGNLAELREEAGRAPVRERALLRDLAGGTENAVDLFLREVQAIWSELYPSADGQVLEGARQLGLPADATYLADLVSRATFPRFAAALVRVVWEGTAEQVRAAARIPQR
ncbi:MAG: hypothetical protein ACYC4R_10080 [Anaerolineae bacterium]